MKIGEMNMKKQTAILIVIIIFLSPCLFCMQPEYNFVMITNTIKEEILISIKYKDETKLETNLSNKIMFKSECGENLGFVKSSFSNELILPSGKTSNIFRIQRFNNDSKISPLIKIDTLFEKFDVQRSDGTIILTKDDLSEGMFKSYERNRDYYNELVITQEMLNKAIGK